MTPEQCAPADFQCPRIASKPANESERLAALFRYEILDTGPEAAFDGLTALAAQICRTPIAVFSLVDENRQWIKSHTGMEEKEIPRAISFCAHAILQNEIFVVEDTAADPRFAENPLVIGPPYIRFYAGISLVTLEGYALGTLHVIDRVPRQLQIEESQALRLLGQQIMTQMESRRGLLELSRALADHNQNIRSFNQTEDLYYSLLNGMPQHIFCKDLEGRYTFGNRRFCAAVGKPLGGILGKTDFDIHPRELAEQYRRDDTDVIRTGKELDKIEECTYSGGESTFVHLVKIPIKNSEGRVIGVQGTTWDVTERVKIEKDLAYERDLLRTLLDNCPDRIYFKDRNSRFIKCSMAVAAGLGITSPDQAVNKSDFDFFTEEHARPAFEDEQWIMRTGEPIIGLVEKETWIDGRLTWAMTTKMPLRSKTGVIIGTFGITKDITALKEFESELAYERDLLRTLLENAPDCIYFKDTSSRYLMCSKALADRLHIPDPELMVGKTDFDFFTGDYAGSALEDEQEIMRTGQPILSKLFKETLPDGRFFWTITTRMPLRNKDGIIIGTFGISKDITDLINTEKELAYERDLLRSLLDSIPDRISFKDRDSRFLKCSRALIKRLGFEHPEQVIGKTDFDFHPWDKAQEYFADEQRIIATGEPLIHKIERQVDREGRESWASVSKVPIIDKDGNTTGVIALSRDISALKKAEAESKLARDAAIESARLKSEFLANMSHEIRTPMNAIVGMTGILLDTELTPEQKDFTETIRISTEALLNIINDILDFSKIEAGKLVFDVIDFDIPEMVEGTVEILASRAHAKGLELLFWIHSDTPTCLRGDPGRIRQVLANLLSNAVKFTEKGEVVLKVEKDSESETDVVLRFTVSDTGIGIPEQALPLLFQAFTQADGSMTRKYGGTGLGLAISRQLVELMQGEIGVESTLGKGSNFWFTLRLQKSSAPSVAAIQEREKGNLIGLRALIVDDNDTNRQILEHQLDSWRIRSRQASSGSEALHTLLQAVADKDPFQLVILDQQMPEMDGLTLANNILSDPQLRQTHLVMLTSMGQRIEPDVLRRCGISSCLVKPVKKSRLFDCISTVIAEAEGHISGKASDVPAHARPELATHEFSKNIRILLAEDNAVNQKVALRQLQKIGFTADAVANGIEALDALQRIPYNMIFMDCQMPEMDGYEATRRLREAEKSNGNRLQQCRHYVIAMTANALKGDREKCLEAGMDDYVSKPVQLSDLRNAVDRAILILQSPVPAPAPPQIVEEVLDPAILACLRRLGMPGDPDPLTEFIDLYLEDAPHQFKQLEENLSYQDISEFQSVAHSLKGSSNNLGAHRLGSHCQDLEQLAKAGDLDGARVLLPTAKAELEKVLKALNAERQKSLAQ